MGQMIVFPGDRSPLATIKGFYPRAIAARIARVPSRVVLEWDRKGIVVPTFKLIDAEGDATEGYDLEGITYLRLIRELRQMSFTLEKIVTAVEYLSRFGPPGPAWADARIFTDRIDIWVESRSNPILTSASRAGQTGMHDVLFASEFERLVERLDALIVPQPFAPFVELNPDVRNGMPVVLGTGIETSTIRSFRKAGYRPFEIERNYPYITREQIVQADRFERFLDDQSAAAA